MNASEASPLIIGNGHSGGGFKLVKTPSFIGAPPRHMNELMQIRSSTSEKSEEEAHDLGLEAPEKSIGNIGSFSLIANNIAGPGMMSLPHVFYLAGWLPTIVCIILAFFGSSLCGTLLADSISSLPGNSDFTQNIEFSLAFNILGGDIWYIIAEILFILSCMVQCSSGIVEVAHSLDAVIASLVLGKTYAFQLYPTLDFLVWSPDSCAAMRDDDNARSNTTSSCTPFYSNGPFIISLGYLLTVVIFFPLGRGHLKENVSFQIFGFAFFLGVTFLFFKEFIFSTGLSFTVPMIGPDVGQLVGVVLFNYAFAITVPAWLNEKKSHVSVNTTIWGSTSILSIVYIFFGLLGAMAFSDPPSDMLSMLGSKQSSPVTRVCAALFGVIIIGCGVPIYCVLIKNTLYAGRSCDVHTSYFVGAVFPYLVSWLMYQGTMMLTVLSWTGLVVNGLVAFILPLVLAIFTYNARRNSLAKLKKLEDEEVGYISSLVKRTPSGRILALLSSRLQRSNLSSKPLLTAALDNPPSSSQRSSLAVSGASLLPGWWPCLCSSSKPLSRATGRMPSTEADAITIKGIDHLGRSLPACRPQTSPTAARVPKDLPKEHTPLPRLPDLLAAQPAVPDLQPSWEDEDMILDGSVYPLYSFLAPIKELLVYGILAIFLGLITCTVIRNSIRAVEHVSDDYSVADDDTQ